jgi:isopenicillin N synthase-like dioxygenase
MVSNDEYKSVEHRVRAKSSQDSRVSIGIFFKPCGSNLIGPLPELVTPETPRRFRSFTMAEFLNSRRELGHGTSSINFFRTSA